ncbi:acyl-CoA N-acyltransferase [Massariosphaeria phaeospora]|uniref:Acyl-CoA N-acyltransferase n=1 Tax=Massariosphaeria phaeospora TaxID=100035 RepID=A0A7C8M8F1_9PLEO|nr:acyl-CoA N-acyltransferase [Massariosphaeria phaeospora]
MASQKPEILVVPADSPKHKATVTTLFTAYAQSLDIDLSFQNFEQELASLPGKYTPETGGALFLAYSRPTASSLSPPSSKQSPPSHAAVGCVALRAFSPPSICELKRLYIIPEARGLGAGRELMDTVIGKAKELGYKEILLDTLRSIVKARKMYARYGFVDVEKYYDNPLDGTCFMRLVLHQGSSRPIFAEEQPNLVQTEF